jgi:hypothetical protein
MFSIQNERQIVYSMKQLHTFRPYSPIHKFGLYGSSSRKKEPVRFAVLSYLQSFIGQRADSHGRVKANGTDRTNEVLLYYVGDENAYVSHTASTIRTRNEEAR